MSDLSFRSDATVPARSALVFGNEPNAVVSLAVALAARDPAPFGWARAPGDLARLERSVVDFVGRRARGPTIDRYSPRDFDVPEADPARVAEVVELASIPPGMRNTLGELLTLPPILQQLVARSDPDRPGGALLVTGTESLPRAYLERGFGRKRTHRDLAELGFSLITAYRGMPPSALREAWDLRYEIVAVPGRPWREATVVPEDPEAYGDAVRSSSLGELWRALALDPTGIAVPSGR